MATDEVEQFIKKASVEDIQKALDRWGAVNGLHKKDGCDGVYKIQDELVTFIVRSEEGDDVWPEKQQVVKCNKCGASYIFFLVMDSYYYYYLKFGDI